MAAFNHVRPASIMLELTVTSGEEQEEASEWKGEKYDGLVKVNKASGGEGWRANSALWERKGGRM